MKKWIIYCGAVLCAMHSVISYADSGISVSARNFFDSYVKMGDEYDVKIANLYSDDAQISSGSMNWPGAVYKKMLIKHMPDLKREKNADSYSDIKVTETNAGAIIRAKRYSKTQCYYDDSYTMELAKNSSGVLQIIKESSATQPNAKCQK